VLGDLSSTIHHPAGQRMGSFETSLGNLEIQRVATYSRG
jgi:hypothetical protein